ncbi:MAG: UDP-N-acetylmuramate dehydrogenase [Planctomycetes bacterium]|nr:UDP-N-acetylmuramate dehydrogenase [Planctomycetota bacterium]
MQGVTTASSLPPGIAFREGEPLAARTSLRIGGPADILALPSDIAQLGALISWANAAGIAPFVLGRGTNILFPDEGLRGLVIGTERIHALQVEGTRIRAGAGATIRSLIRLALKLGLSGLEHLVGIPGSLGGAVRMNAGTREGTIGGLVSEVLVVEGDGRVQRRAGRDLAWGYRRGAVGDGEVAAQIVLQLEPGSRDRIRDAMRRTMAARVERQPLRWPSAGCMFRNPDGESAGRLIERAGMKGVRQGGARVSDRHANFILNDGGATAREMRALIDAVRREVAARFGIELTLEVVLA